jgi:very-short-patch-repair endonuclease
MNKSEILKHNARRLRKNMTETEIRLWQRIRKKQLNNLQFYRQRNLGKYIVDFYCPARKLVIEIDGGQHYDFGELTEKDKERESYLKNILKLKIVRFTNVDILKNIHSVIDGLIKELL